MRSLVYVALLALAIGVGPAPAQTTAPAAAPMSQDQKKAISKSCTDQANAQRLARQGAEEIQVRVQKGGW
jgi:type II secretory pathway component PulM